MSQKTISSQSYNLLFWLLFGGTIGLVVFEVYLFFLALLSNHHITVGWIGFMFVRLSLFAISPFVDRKWGSVFVGCYIVLFLVFLSKDVQS